MTDDQSSTAESWLPLKPVVLHILISLAEQESHAYGIVLSVQDRSVGRILLETGPLYRHLKKLLAGGLIEESENRPPDDDPRRGAYYALTPLGREVVSAELNRLRGLLSVTKKIGLMSSGGTT